MNEAEKILLSFCETIEVTGGLVTREGKWGNKVVVPNADKDWSDLASVYLAACEALGRTPIIDTQGDEYGY